MHLALTSCLAAVAVAFLGCATPPDSSGIPAAAGNATSSSARKDEGEVVTGSRLPVRGAQPVRTIDKEEITRNSGVIGVPAKGN